MYNVCGKPYDTKAIEMNNRANYYDIEKLCQHFFDKLGSVYHLCTPENHPIIFRNSEDFKRGMTLLGIAAIYHKKVRFITFELMNNHIHIIIEGKEYDITEFFECFKRLLYKCLHTDGVRPDLNGFTMKLHQINNLENIRNAIAYANRNGSVVDRHVCPFTYPWGSNRYFFNTESKTRYEEQKSIMKMRQKREITQSRKYDKTEDLYLVDGYVCPLSFCHVEYGEHMFRDARHYFAKVSRHIESYDEIAKMIGEQIYYTDDDLFSIACTLSAKEYDCKTPSQLPKDDKIKLARHLIKEYNAGSKQIQRMLKIDAAIMTALFGNSKL